jgi:DNA adenine methylase
MNEIKIHEHNQFPPTRFMGSKRKLLDFIYDNVRQFEGERVLDAFSGSGCVSYMFKSMGKEVISNDFLQYSYNITKATIENNCSRLSHDDISNLNSTNREHDDFVLKKFRNLYFSDDDNKIIDQIYHNIQFLDNEYKKAIALSSLARACIKKRARGIFTYTGNRYDDGRRDLNIPLQKQFMESIELFNASVFDNGKCNKAHNLDVFNLPDEEYDLVYLDPPYCSLHSDNDYSRRYHFVEGLMSYWTHVKINESTKTKKFNKFLTPFDSKVTVYDAFDRLFQKYSDSNIVISYSSNSLPTMDEMILLLKRYKQSVRVSEFSHKYSFGNQKLNIENNKVKEYLFIGTD